MLYVARHGETQWNVQNKVCGLTDIELTQKGFEQAKKLALLLKDKKIDLIISSPLKRAIVTSTEVSKICNAPIEIDCRLIEQNYGIFEGVDRQDEAFLNNKKCFAYKYPGGDSMMQVAFRTYSLIEEIKVKNKGKNMLLVCHGGVCRVINTYFNDMTNDEFFCFSPDNCSYLEYEL